MTESLKNWKEKMAYLHVRIWVISVFTPVEIVIFSIFDWSAVMLRVTTQSSVSSEATFDV